MKTPQEFDVGIDRIRRLLSDWKALYPDAHDISLTTGGGGGGGAGPTTGGDVPDPTHDVVWDPRKAAVRDAMEKAGAVIDEAHQDLLQARNRAEYALGLRKKSWDVSEAQAAENRSAKQVERRQRAAGRRHAERRAG